MLTPFAASEEHSYFLEIEVQFNTLRGSASLLNPGDWQVANRWWQQGIPLTIVRSALENVFARRLERGERSKIQSLSYCASAVDNAFEHLKELGYGEHPTVEPTSLDQRLEGLITRLGDFGHLHSVEILDCAEGISDAAEVERKLAELELRLARSKRKALEASLKDTLDQQLQDRLIAATEPLRSRLDVSTMNRTRARTAERLLRELTGIPRLSLFD